MAVIDFNLPCPCEAANVRLDSFFLPFSLVSPCVVLWQKIILLPSDSLSIPAVFVPDISNYCCSGLLVSLD